MSDRKYDKYHAGAALSKYSHQRGDKIADVMDYAQKQAWQYGEDIGIFELKHIVKAPDLVKSLTVEEPK